MAIVQEDIRAGLRHCRSSGSFQLTLLGHVSSIGLLALLYTLSKMRVSLSTVLTAALGLASSSDALRILMGNDDGFGSGNLRELYKLLNEAGHEGTLQLILSKSSR